MNALPTIRAEQCTSDDRAAIRVIHEAAFGRPDEADLVDALRSEGCVLVSLLAESEAAIIGHILFTRMSIDTGTRPVQAVALAPLAVLPAHRKQGIGARLIREGLSALRASGERIVIVLGHPEYYTRFGFSVETAAALKSPFPPEAFMAAELAPGALEGVHGAVRYPTAFGV
jgi:putative acetyltransferase